MAGGRGTEALSDTASAGIPGVSHTALTASLSGGHLALGAHRTVHPCTAVLLTPLPGVPRGAGAGAGGQAGAAITAGTDLQPGLAGPSCEATGAVTQKTTRLIWNVFMLRDNDGGTTRSLSLSDLS